MSKMRGRKHKISCWNCDLDYTKKFKESDLIPMTLYGQLEAVCPDCYDSVPEDALEEVCHD